MGVEFASYYADMGTKVTVLEYLPSLVPLEDREIGKELERSFKRRGIDVMTSARFDTAKVEVTKQGVCLMVGPEGQPQAELRAEQMLVATGRAANVEDVGLETTRAKVEKGVVQVDPRTMRTAEPHLYAIGEHHRRAVAGPCRRPRGPGRSRRDQQHGGRAGRLPQDAAGHLLAAPDRLDRPQRTGLRARRHRLQERQVPRLANGKALIGGDYEGFVKGYRRPRHGRRAGRPHDRPVRDRLDR